MEACFVSPLSSLQCGVFYVFCWLSLSRRSVQPWNRAVELPPPGHHCCVFPVPKSRPLKALTGNRFHFSDFCLGLCPFTLDPPMWLSLHLIFFSLFPSLRDFHSFCVYEIERTTIILSKAISVNKLLNAYNTQIWG